MARHNIGGAVSHDGARTEDTAMGLRVGQQVVCISDAFSPCPYWRRALTALPKLHMIYTIRDMRVAHGLLGLCFYEIVSPRAHFSEGYVEPAFNSKNFRPVKRTSIDVFETLLAPTPTRPLELV
jgi:hypothetical protein